MIARLRQATYAVIRMDWNFDPAFFQAVGQAESVTWRTWAVRGRGLTRAALAAQAWANASAEQTRAFFQTGGPHCTGARDAPIQDGYLPAQVPGPVPQTGDLATIAARLTLPSVPDGSSFPMHQHQ